MKYKVGDKVRVRSDLETGEYYGDDQFIDQMADLRGKIVTIESVCPSDYRKYYYVAESIYNLTDEMLEDIVEDENTTIEQLKLKLKQKDAQIAYLKGQVHAYKEVLRLEDK